MFARSQRNPVVGSEAGQNIGESIFGLPRTPELPEVFTKTAKGLLSTETVEFLQEVQV
jgi:hypothetical protein